MGLVSELLQSPKSESMVTGRVIWPLLSQVSFAAHFPSRHAFLSPGYV